MTQATSDLTKFQWSPQPKAAALVQELLDEFLKRCPDAAKFAKRLHRETGTRFIDWISWIGAGPSSWAARVRECGFEPDRSEERFRHPAAMFPMIVIAKKNSRDSIEVNVRADSVADFLFANRLPDRYGIIGEPGVPSRFTLVYSTGRASMGVRESHGENREKFVPRDNQAAAIRELFRLRRRAFDEETAGFEDANQLIDEAVKAVGPDRAADLFFSAEREYWMSRNRAAQIQYARQQRLGLGWANHDHHTYRSSREHFKDLIAIFEKLGLVCRERFYAGREAGWGAQVMEQPNAGIVVFADVDLSPDEVTADFAHEPLAPRKELGTVGLWCALHGESFLEAGMHHLECQFDFDAAREQLAALGVNSMKPFTDFPYLKQCFTEGEMWPVEPKRIEALLAAGRITPEQAEKFRRQGAIGSHLEILERNDGYKGFNQTGISEIIRQTDPRNAGGARG